MSVPFPPAERAIVVRDFAAEAEAMRACFDERFADHRRVGRERFVWDYWYVPEQYTYVRTMADHYFPRPLYRRFLGRLRAWGAETLGCETPSRPWLSYYLDGGHQALHTDAHHGPWAFVFSLTRWEERGFQGGETIILRPEVMDFGRALGRAGSLEMPSMVDRIPAPFNQLVLFDPRIPHGVSRVSGTWDPQDSRLVLHGWFASPRHAAGPGIAIERVEAAGLALGDRLAADLPGAESLVGWLVARLAIGPEGRVEGVELLPDTLLPTEGGAERVEAVRVRVSELAKELLLAAPGEPSWARLALHFPLGGRD